jgi:sugar fermentation stimulation protein A
MQLPVPLQSATLVRRYKRFLVDCTLADATTVTAHIADPGRLPGLVDEGARLWLSASDDPRRKLAHRVELIESGGTLVGANTANANRLVAEALAARRLPSLAGWTVTARESRLNQRTRLDFRLADEAGRTGFLEVKNITWRRDSGARESGRRGGVAAFPDAVTSRGTKHLAALARLAASGTPAFLFFVCQRRDVAGVTIAADIDPAYAAGFALALAAGVQVLACRCELNHYAIKITDEVAIG